MFSLFKKKIEARPSLEEPRFRILEDGLGNFYIQELSYSFGDSYYLTRNITKKNGLNHFSTLEAAKEYIDNVLKQEIVKYHPYP